MQNSLVYATHLSQFKDPCCIICESSNQTVGVEREGEGSGEGWGNTGKDKGKKEGHRNSELPRLKKVG